MEARTAKYSHLNMNRFAFCVMVQETYIPVLSYHIKIISQMQNTHLLCTVLTGFSEKSLWRLTSIYTQVL
jgi:hypothetical protein